jgi:hypothetical protein
MMMRVAWGVALITISSCASGEKEAPAAPRYVFRKGDVLRYAVTSTLEVMMAGTHPDFLPDGNESPLKWSVDGEFENVVIDVNAGGAAQLERRVKQVKSSGHFQKEKIDYDWDRARDRVVPDESKLTFILDRFIATVIQLPAKITVRADGKSTTEQADFQRLIMRRGMMYWPMGGGERWATSEEIAIPILHDRVTIDFDNVVTGDREGKLSVLARASLKRSESTGFHDEEFGYAVKGGAKAEFDRKSGRLIDLELDLKIVARGQAKAAEGLEGDIRVLFSYRETQRLVR